MGEPVGMGMEFGAAWLGGQQQKNAYKMEAAQMQTEKKAMETNAAISQAERMRKLKTIIATQNAAFAMGGQTAGVGTANAIQAASISEANREQRTENLQKDIATLSYDYNIWSANKAAKHAMTTSMVNLGIDFGSRVHSTGIKFLSNMMKKKFSGGMMGGGGGG